MNVTVKILNNLKIFKPFKICLVTMDVENKKCFIGK